MTPKIGRRLTDAETAKAAVLAAYIDASPHEWPKGVADIALLCHGYLDLRAALAEAREDSARLDWLERQTSFEGLYVWPRWEPTSANPECDWAWFTAACKAGPFETMRAAIDAARGNP
jgi:hypothetical protein